MKTKTKKTPTKKAPARTKPAATLPNGLKPAEEMFCQLYAGSREYFNNATRAYMVAFEYEEIEVPEVTHPAPPKEARADDDGSDAENLRVFWDWPKWYMDELKAHADALEAIRRQERTAAACAARLLTKAKVRARCGELLHARLTDKEVDTELAGLIHQQEEKPVKIRAISEYNKLKGRIIEKRHFTGAIATTEIDEKGKKALDEILKANA